MAFRHRDDVISRIVGCRRWLRYWRHLADVGFTANDPIYRLFAADVFHDGEIRIKGIDLGKRNVTMEFRNVYAVDQVHSHLKDKGIDDPPIDRRDFRTGIRFQEVELFGCKLQRPTRPVFYQISELTRAGSSVRLKIGYLSEWKESLIEIVFGAAEVEDITPKIQKYLGKAVNAQEIISWVTDAPTHYVAECEARLKRMTWR